MLKPTEAPKGQDAPEITRLSLADKEGYGVNSNPNDFPNPDAPETIESLCYYLRVMADGPVDAINADRLSRAADLLTAALARAEQAEAEVARLRAALTPSGDTKAAYMGEIKDPETKRHVSWTAIKMIMAMIAARAALREGGKDPAARCAECDCENGGTDCNWIKSDTAQKGDE
jgi:hypothetical protein